MSNYRLTKRGKIVVTCCYFLTYIGFMTFSLFMSTRIATAGFDPSKPSEIERVSSRTMAVAATAGPNTHPDAGTSEAAESAQPDAKEILFNGEKVFRKNSRAGKLVALTFDDGPNQVWTEKYLAILETYHVRATFFLVGQRVEKYPELVKKISEKNCEIASHSYTHSRLILKKSNVIKEDFQKSVAAFDRAGATVHLFRPPYGEVNNDLIKAAEEFNQLIVGWNVDPEDWKQTNAQYTALRVVSKVTPGSIVLLHEGRSITFKALPQIINALQKKGYQFVTVSELMQVR